MTTMRLYRGLTRPYRSDRVIKAGQPITGTNFTDCPFTALRYAQGASGVVLVLDIDPDSPKVSEELWLGMATRRFIVWGSIDRFMVGTALAKDLRALVRKKGVVTYDDSAKARILRRAIDEKLLQHEPAPRSGPPPSAQS